MKKILFACCLCGVVFVQDELRATNQIYRDAVAATRSADLLNASSFSEFLTKYHDTAAFAMLLTATILKQLESATSMSFELDYADTIAKKNEDEFVEFFESNFVEPYGSEKSKMEWGRMKAAKKIDGNVVVSISSAIKQNIEQAYRERAGKIKKYVGLVANRTTKWTGTLINIGEEEEDLKGKIVLTTANDTLKDRCKRECTFTINGKEYKVHRCMVHPKTNIAVLILDEAVGSGTELTLEIVKSVAEGKTNFFTIGYDSNFGFKTPRATRETTVKTTQKETETAIEIELQGSPDRNLGDNGAPIISKGEGGEKDKIIGIYTKRGEDSWLINEQLTNWIKEEVRRAESDVKPERPEITETMRGKEFDELTYLGEWVLWSTIGNNIMYDEGGVWNKIKTYRQDLKAFITDVNQASETCADADSLARKAMNFGKKLTPDSKKELCSRFINTGNCGELANYFMFPISCFVAKTDAEMLKNIKQRLEESSCMVFRITLQGSHTFVGIKIDNKVEVFQAWQEAYTIRDWLDSKKNHFYIDQFIELLAKITVKAEEATKFYKAKDESLRLDKKNIKIKSFAFKTFNNKSELEGAIKLEPLNGPACIPEVVICLSKE